MKNTPDEMNGSVDVAEEKMGELKDIATKTIQTETEKSLKKISEHQ